LREGQAKVWAPDRRSELMSKLAPC
jgi:hypothetical protein